jgi:hypothetical protein
VLRSFVLALDWLGLLTALKECRAPRAAALLLAERLLTDFVRALILKARDLKKTRFETTQVQTDLVKLLADQLPVKDRHLFRLLFARGSLRLDTPQDPLYFQGPDSHLVSLVRSDLVELASG